MGHELIKVPFSIDQIASCKFSYTVIFLMRKGSLPLKTPLTESESIIFIHTHTHTLTQQKQQLFRSAPIGKSEAEKH